MMDFHENWDDTPDEVKDMHRALTSLKEEIEAVDWYHQRQAMSRDDDLKSILIHNRDEEIEHAVMTLEWLRRRVPAWDEQLRTYLFTTEPVTEVERRSPGAGNGGGKGEDLGIGKIE
jgi:hypothetical protein